MSTLININRFVEVELTSRGASVLNHYFEEIHLWNTKFTYTQYKAGDKYKCQLWELMKIFGGDNIDISEDSPFKDCFIYVDFNKL